MCRGTEGPVLNPGTSGLESGLPPTPTPGPTEAREAHSLLASWALRGASHPACAPTPGPKPDSASDELHEPGQVIRPPGFGFPTSKMEMMTAPEPQDRGDGSVGVRWLSPAAAAAPAPTAGRALGINQPRPARRCHLPPAPAPHPTRAAPHPSRAERASFDPETLREGTSHLDRTRCVLSRPSVHPEARTRDDDCSVTTRAGAGAGAGVLLSRSRRGPRRHPAALQGRPRPCARRNRCSSLGRFGPDGLRNTGG